MSHATTNTVAAKSCLECRRRKIKCDKSIPCSYCVKVKVKCRYPAPKSNSNKGGNLSQSNEVLSTRIDRIEGTLQSFEHSISQIYELLQQSHPPSRPGQNHNRGLETPPANEQILSAGRITGSASITFDSERSSRSQNDPGFQVLPSHDGTGSPFRLSTTASLDSLHPPPTTIFFLWQTYLERVDPVLKIIHTPTVQRDIMEFVRDESHLDPTRHILFFAIYYTSVITMSEEECGEELQQSKGEALKRIRGELERSLERSDLLNISEITIFQAFVLYIVCGRCDKQGPDTKRLTEVAVKIAFQNKLHRDGLELDISPFEVEIRRRLWWQICILDVRTAEDNGSDPHILSTSFTTRFPSNVNDASLHADMSEMPQANLGRTEMSFTLVRFEGSNFARRIVFSDKFCQENSYEILTAPEKCVVINKFREQVEQQYLSTLDKSIPLDFITAASIRLILVKLKLTVNKPRVRQNQHLIMQKSFRRTCVEILERARMLRQYEKGRQWLWLFQTYLEWDALSYLFINLSLVPAGDDVNLAWSAADDIYEYWKNRSDIFLDRRWRNIEELRSRALHARDLVQREPSVFVDGYDSDHLDSIALETPSQDAPATQSGVTSPTLQGGITQSLDVPSAGTGCQWSTGIFERYFEVLDSEHDLRSSWL